jgi:hypothetical protein
MRLGLIILFFLHLVHPTYAISFTIGNPQIDNEIINVPVFLSGFSSSNCASSSACYLQGALQKPSVNSYFGSTKNNIGNWYSCTRTQDKDFIKSTFFSFFQTNGDWSGAILMKAEISTGYSGPGEYILKVWRYTGNSESPAGESNEQTVNILQPTLSPTPTNSPFPTNTSTNSPQATSTNPIVTQKSTNTITPKPTEKGTVTPTSSSQTSTSSGKNGEEGEILGAKDDSTATSSVAMERAASYKIFIITFLFIGIGSALLSLALVLRKQFFSS